MVLFYRLENTLVFFLHQQYKSFLTAIWQNLGGEKIKKS